MDSRVSGHEETMGGGGVPGWMKPPKPFKPRKILLPPGYKRNGALEEQECGGGKYTGEWKDGMMHGKGEFSSDIRFTREGKERGDRYVGEWQFGKQHGKGTYHYRNLDRYEGEWADGQKHGYGTLYLANGDKYSSDWRHGDRQGRGTWTGANGNTFTANDLEALIGTRRPLGETTDSLDKTKESELSEKDQ